MGTYIERFWTENTGGGCMVDFVQLKDGHIIAISDEAAVVYKNYDAWLEADGQEADSQIMWFKDLNGRN